MTSRRSILKLLTMAAYLLTARPSKAISSIFIRPKAKKRSRVIENPFVGSNGRPLVGVAWGRAPYMAIREAVDLIGGFSRLDIRGKRVLVKPNVVSGKPHPATTNPEVVSGVVRVLYEEGAREVVVGDMSALLTLSTWRNMAANGIKEAAEKEGAKVVAFEDHGWIEVDTPQGLYIKRAYITEWIYRVDLIVNLPVIKTHRSASYSICLKNFIGCTHLRQRPYFVDREHWEEVVAEFNLAYTPEVNIVDGTLSMIEGGPWEGRAVQTDLIIAGGDRVATDAVGLGIIKSFGRWNMVTDKPVWEQRQLKRALALGIGRKDLSLRLSNGPETFLSLMERVKEALFETS